jgi:hypothetical protein
MVIREMAAYKEKQYSEVVEKAKKYQLFKTASIFDELTEFDRDNESRKIGMFLGEVDEERAGIIANALEGKFARDLDFHQKND